MVKNLCVCGIEDYQAPIETVVYLFWLPDNLLAKLSLIIICTHRVPPFTSYYIAQLLVYGIGRE